MIVKISGSGKSFKGLSDYLTHDPNKAKTVERVAWTHTINLPDDHVPSAVNTMYLTAENAELLKQQAGVRGGGGTAEHPVKHISLSWHQDDNPSQQHMLATSKQFLQSMGWGEHQAILVAHSDKPHKHVHIILNEVHPETGLLLNHDYECERARKWGLAYEREQGVIRCEQRTLNPEEREKAMPRNMWAAFKKKEQEFQKSEELLRQNSDIPEYSPENRAKEEWKILKEFQKEERLAFFAQGKLEFKELRSSIYREVREAFREPWSAYFAALKAGRPPDEVFSFKEQIIAEQKATLEPLRDAACAELREARDLKYRELLDGQKTVRAEFTERLETGLDNTSYFNDLAQKSSSRKQAALAFREASIEVTTNFQGEQPRALLRAAVEDAPGRTARSHRGRDIADLGKRRAVAGVAAVADSLFSFLTNLGSAPPRPVSAEEKENQFREAAENALKQHQQHEREEDDARWRERQRTYGE